MHFKPGERVTVRGSNESFVIRSIDDTTVSAMIKEGKRTVLKRFKISDLARPGEGTALEGDDNAVVQGVAPGLIELTPKALDFTALLSGHLFRKTSGEFVSVSRKEAGTLTVESGRLTASDPSLLDDALPFRVQVPTGHYPVALLSSGDGGQRRNVAAVLELSQQIPERLEPAFFDAADEAPGNEPSNVYGIDSGKGCFADFEVVTGGGRPSAEARVSFDSGYGDGGAASFLGYTSDHLVAVLTDFGVLDEPRTGVLEFPGIRRHRSGTLRHELLDAVGIRGEFENYELRIRCRVTQMEGAAVWIDSEHEFVDPSGSQQGSCRDEGSSGARVVTSIFEIIFATPPTPDGALRLKLRTMRPLASSLPSVGND